MAGDGPAAIEAVGLTKRFGETRAVSGVDLRMPAGGVYGVLGPNGAGKTTTIRMLATLLLPDSGCARIFGHDVVREADAVRERISLTGQFASVDEDLTGAENLVLLGRLLGYPRRRAAARAGELLNAFELTEAGTRPVKTYSGGMRRRLDIATSIVVAPQLLFLDEPTTGLDPHSRSDVWRLVRTLVAEGTTVLLTTQYLDEADQLADHITVIDHGTVVAAGTPNELKVATGTATLRIRVGDPGQRAQVSARLSQALDLPVELGSDPVELSAAGADPQRVIYALAELSRAELSVASFSLSQPSLDEVFRALTGHLAADQESAA